MPLRPMANRLVDGLHEVVVLPHEVLREEEGAHALVVLACARTGARGHSSLEFAVPMGILHVNESEGGLIAEGPRRACPAARRRSAPPAYT